MADRPKIGVVTVTYNSAEVLPDFLRCTFAQSYGNFILYAVDNASTDSTLEALRACADLRLKIIANPDNRGVAEGNNQGIRAALNVGCQYVLLLNNDVVFPSDLFQKLLEGLTANRCQMTAPLIYYHDRPNIIWAAGGHFQPWLGYRCSHNGTGDLDSGQYSKPMRVPHAPTCCVLIEKDVFSRIGVMDERYFVYHDDTDFMLRAFKFGERLYLLPHVKLWHKVSSLTGGKESNFSIRYGTRNRAFLLVKFSGKLISFPYSIAYRLLYLIRLVTGRDSHTIFSLKQRSWTEGASIPSNWLPFRPSSHV